MGLAVEGMAHGWVSAFACAATVFLVVPEASHPDVCCVCTCSAPDKEAAACSVAQFLQHAVDSIRYVFFALACSHSLGSSGHKPTALHDRAGVRHAGLQKQPG